MTCNQDKRNEIIPNRKEERTVEVDLSLFS